MHKRKKDSPLPFYFSPCDTHMCNRCQQTTTRVQLVKMLRNMTDYSNMYNTIPNCLKAKMRRIVDFAINRCHYCMDAIT